MSAQYDFVGKVLQAKTHQTFEGTSTNIVEKYEYDRTGRLLKVWHKVNGGSDVLIAGHTYNELGQLASKKVGGDAAPVQQMDYKYNIRGWLTQINNPDEAAENTKQFAMRLHYNSTLANLSNQAQYNGNIAAVEWRTPANSNTGITADKQGYGFTYDSQGRLIAADYGEGSNFTTNANAFNVTIAGYDLNGNIKGITRNGDINTGSSWVQNQIDNLQYTYNGNQLQSVVDQADAAPKDFDNTLVKDYGFKDGTATGVELPLRS